MPTFSVLTQALPTTRCDLMLLVVRDDGSDSPLLSELDRATSGTLAGALQRERFGSAGNTASYFPGLAGIRAGALLVCSAKDTTDPNELRGAAAAAGQKASNTGAAHVHVARDGEPIGASDARAVAEGLGLGSYHFDKYLEAERRGRRNLKRLSVLGQRRGARSTSGAMARGWTVAEAQNFARDLVNEPPNVFHPVSAVRIGRRLAKETGMSIRVLNEAECKRRKMGAFLAVAQGSAFSPSLVHLSWKPNGVKARGRVALVGKCLTFDSGGLCIKPPAGMASMKADMGGAAAVLGAMRAVAELKLPVEVHGIYAAAENMTGAAAYRTGDVLTASNGKTIEVLNTDAEGRLTLADALVYAGKLKPDTIVDLATLTGACMVALGEQYSGLFSNDDGLADSLSSAAHRSGEKLWRLPLPEEYRELIRSKVATIKNVGPRWGGAITAALFLQEFVPAGVRWAHLDIAGPSTTDKPRGVHAAGGTGEPVRTLVSYVESL
jgi:leucyl aminopeptidase